MTADDPARNGQAGAVIEGVGLHKPMFAVRHKLRAGLLAVLLAGVASAGPVLATEGVDAQLYRAQAALAEAGKPRAQYHFGEMHELGLGTPPNLTEAFYWYTKAAQQGYAPAQRKISMRGQIEAEQALARAAEDARRKNTTQATPAPSTPVNTTVIARRPATAPPPLRDPQAVAREQRREALRRRLEQDAGLRLDRPTR